MPTARSSFRLPLNNVGFWHRYTIDSPGSGSIFIDNVFLRPLPDPGSAGWNEVVPFGAQRRYSLLAPPANWFQPASTMIMLRQGQGKIWGRERTAEYPNCSSPDFSPADYFRKTFALSGTNLEEFLLSATCTQSQNGPAMQIYLNGPLVPATDIGGGFGPGQRSVFTSTWLRSLDYCNPART